MERLKILVTRMPTQVAEVLLAVHREFKDLKRINKIFREPEMRLVVTEAAKV